jgi:hypothetical protein
MEARRVAVLRGPRGEARIPEIGRAEEVQPLVAEDMPLLAGLAGPLLERMRNNIPRQQDNQEQRPNEPQQPEKRRGTKKLVDWLLEVHPHACSMPDSSGRLPIHLAIASGKEWENGVQSLANGFPGGVSIADPSSGLYPFMSAATSTSDLTTIFELLRFSPHTITVANTET